MEKRKNKNEGFDDALKLFKSVAGNVPAYSKFLKKNKIKKEKIKTYSDFLQVPPINKNNYLKYYPLKDLISKKQKISVISMSSGSSGSPSYWPRTIEQEERGGILHEKIFSKIFGIKKKDKTLVVICFSMGTWIAGTFTLSSCRYILNKGYNLSMITPGIEIKDIVNILKNLAPNFDNVVLAGYPPFIMDAISTALKDGVNISKLNLNVLLAGENFSEKWRETLKKTSSMKNSLNNCISIYGTADADILGHETPLTIFLRRLATKNKKFAKELFFEQQYLPTLVQYNPKEKYFEEIEGNLIFTANVGIPLIRYQINDRGRIIEPEEIKRLSIKYGFESELSKMKKWLNPLITVSGRSDVSVIFYALNIYYENIKACLEDSIINKYVTGKFIARSKNYNNQKDQKLIINIELRPDIQPTDKLKKLIGDTVFKNLLELNTEYRKLFSSMGNKVLPNIVLEEFGSPNFQIKKSKLNWKQNKE